MIQLINAPGVSWLCPALKLAAAPEPRAGMSSKRLSGISQQAEFVG